MIRAMTCWRAIHAGERELAWAAGAERWFLRFQDERREDACLLMAPAADKPIFAVTSGNTNDA